MGVTSHTSSLFTKAPLLYILYLPSPPALPLHTSPALPPTSSLPTTTLLHLEHSLHTATYLPLGGGGGGVDFGWFLICLLRW